MQKLKAFQWLKFLEITLSRCQRLMAIHPTCKQDGLSRHVTVKTVRYSMLQNYLWFIYALGAAILWGLQYATIGQLSKTIPTPLLTLTYTVALAITVGFVFVCFRSELGLAQFKSYWTHRNLLLFGIVVLVGCASTFLIFAAIAEGTTTKASIIEITYPFFVALFATLIYRENTLSWQTFIGGLFILLGAIIVLRS